MMTTHCINRRAIPSLVTFGIFLTILLSPITTLDNDGSNTTPIRKKTLVLLESMLVKDTHSTFFATLKNRKHDLTFKLADDASLMLVNYGELVYDNLILFAPSVQEFGGKIDVKALLAFIDKGGNVLVTANSKVGEVVREFAAECGVEIDEEGSSLIDHMNYDALKDNGDHTTVVVDNDYLIKVPNIGGSDKNPILFNGIGMSNDVDNPLLINVLHGSSSSYSYNPKNPINDYPTAIGMSSAMISAFQARNNARVAFVGSLSFFSDKFFSASTNHAISGQSTAATANEAISKALTKWLFQQAGVLRLKYVEHKKVGGIPDAQAKEASAKTATALNGYTVEDIIEFRAKIEEMFYDEVTGKEAWKAFTAKDIMLEFVRIDPFVRTHLTYLSERREHFLSFKLPDVYGVFKFIVDYNRIGYTHIHSSNQVSVRPIKHTQYERFIEMAFPYYASAFSLMGALLCFSFVFIHHRNGLGSSGDKQKDE